MGSWVVGAQEFALLPIVAPLLPLLCLLLPRFAKANYCFHSLLALLPLLIASTCCFFAAAAAAATFVLNKVLLPFVAAIAAFALNTLLLSTCRF